MDESNAALLDRVLQRKNPTEEEAKVIEMRQELSTLNDSIANAQDFIASNEDNDIIVSTMKKMIGTYETKANRLSAKIRKAEEANIVRPAEERINEAICTILLESGMLGSRVSIRRNPHGSYWVTIGRRA